VAHRCQVHVVDIREREEFDALGQIADAEWVPLDALEGRAASWPSEEPIVLVDRSGRRAARAEEHLTTLGLHRVASLTGGVLAWSAAGYPLAPATLPREAREETETTPAGGDAVYAHLADAENITWVTVASIVGSGEEQCIDGRSHEPVVGTPGGDAGELILALSALEHAARAEVSSEVIERTLEAYVQGFGRFYLHTDRAALERLRAMLLQDPRFADAHESGVLEAGVFEHFVRHPPAELEAPLLEAMVLPEHIGCGHLRLMAQHPSEYGVRRELLEAVLRESFRLGWSHPELLDFAVLEGEHEEAAVVRVWLDQPVHTYTRVPTFPTLAEGEVAFFVAHPEVSAFLRSELGSFLEEHALGVGLPEAERTVFEHELDALAQRQIAATLRYLARDLAVYDVHMHDEVPHVSGPNASLHCREEQPQGHAPQ
jgi:rhodanese-related sulfurtransferase